MHELNAKLKGRRELLGEVHIESDTENAEVIPTPTNPRKSVQRLASSRLVSKGAAGEAAEASDGEASNEEEILESIGRVSSLERVASHQLVKTGIAVAQEQMDEAFWDEEKLPVPERPSLVRLGSRGLVKHGLANMKQVESAPAAAVMTGSLSNVRQVKSSPAMGRTDSSDDIEELPDSTASASMAGAAYFHTRGTGQRWHGGAQFSGRGQTGGKLNQRADAVSLLAAAALGHDLDEDGLVATDSPRNMDDAGQHRTDLLRALSCNSSDTDGASSGPSRPPSELRSSIKGRSSRRLSKSGRRLSWEDQDFSEQWEATGSSTSSARKAEHTRTEPALQGRTIYQDLGTLGEALRDFSNVLECCCGNRAQPPWEANIDATQCNASSGSHRHMQPGFLRQPSSPAGECMPMTPAFMEQPQAPRDMSTKWFECSSTNLERAASAPTPSLRPILVAPRLATSVSFGAPRKKDRQKPQFLPAWTDHICYNSEHATDVPHAVIQAN